MKLTYYVVLSKEEPQTFSDKKKATKYAKDSGGLIYDTHIFMDEKLNIGAREE